MDAPSKARDHHEEAGPSRSSTTAASTIVTSNTKDLDHGHSGHIHQINNDIADPHLNTATTMVTPTSSHNRKKYVSEIEEEEEEGNVRIEAGSRGNLTPMRSEGKESSLFSFDIHNYNGFNNAVMFGGQSEEQAVYVAVGRSDSSKEALLWALDHTVINPSTTLIYLIHVFPELKFIPSPLGGGKVPKSQVSPELADKYTTQERSKQRDLLNKFIDICNVHKVKVETILIESEDVAQAIVDLISVLHIPKLVVGISKSNLRKMRARKGTGIADQILQNAPEWCEVKMICEGKEALANNHHQLEAVGSNNSNASSSKTTPDLTAAAAQRHSSSDNTPFYCCFKPNFSEN